jgi:hypothetical protein
MQNFLVYSMVFILLLMRAFFCVWIFWRILKLTKKYNHATNPFRLGKSFWDEMKKFWTVYLLGDVLRFIMEWMIVWFDNAVILRLVSVIFTLTTSWFFGWLRNTIITEVKAQTKGHLLLREFLGDTVASVLFWVPIYWGELLILRKRDLIDPNQIRISLLVALASNMFFWRISCYFADILEKYVFKKTQ